MKAGWIAWSIVGLLSLADAGGQTIVWTDINARRIQRKDVNGGEVWTIVQFEAPQAATQIHYDPIAAKLYFLFFDRLIFAGDPPTTFRRVNVDGTDPDDIPTPSVGMFTVNVEARKLYWTDSTFGSDRVYRSELNGSGVESHIYPSCCLLTLEAVGDDLFFGAGGAMLKGVWRADADGSNEQFLHFSGQPFDLAHDPVENMLYLADIYAISRMNADGTGFEEIVPRSAVQIVVDSRARKLYWAPGRVIRRSNLDGSNVEDFVTATDAGNPKLDIRGLTIIDSEQVTGACCDGDPFGPCTDDTILSQCECAGCTWRPFQSCAEIECAANPIPTVSVWGLTVLSLLLMIGAKIAFARPVALSRDTHVG